MIFVFLTDNAFSIFFFKSIAEILRNKLEASKGISLIYDNVELKLLYRTIISINNRMMLTAGPEK